MSTGAQSKSNSGWLLMITKEKSPNINEMEFMKQQLIDGLTSVPKYLPVWYRYDKEGSDFNDKCLVDNKYYYFYSAEVEIIKENIMDMVKLLTKETILAEMGSGNSLKTKSFIDAILAYQSSVTYIPVDISEEFLKDVCQSLQNDYKTKLCLIPVPADYDIGIQRLKGIDGNKLILWLGGGFQNQDYEEQILRLQNLSEVMTETDILLVSFDITQETEEIEKAYLDPTDMEPFFKEIVDTYTDSEELRKFVIFWSLENVPYVKEKIFSLQCQELFTWIDQDFQIPTQEPMDCQDLFPELEWPTENNFNDNMQNESEQTRLSYPSASKYYRPWEMNDTEIMSSIPSPQPSGINVTKSQVGKGHPDNKPYTYEMRRKRTFAENKAIDTTYTVKFNENWQGDKLKDLNISLHEMFDDILNKIRGDPTDLGRVVIHHNGLNHPIVVPLQQWEKLDSSVVMEGITNVLNSNEELIVDDSMFVTIGSIEIPKGSGGGKPITSLFGPLNSLQTKQSIFEVINDGYLCLPISIGLCYLKTCNKVRADEWNQLTAEDTHMSTMEKPIKYKVCPIHIYKNMLSKQRRKKMQAKMGETLCKLANVLADRPLCLNDTPPFERLLDINFNVLSSKLGNKFVRVMENPDVNNLFVYLVESDSIQHFHGIPSIAGFFGSSYYCENCMKPYSNRENHSCETTCDVCGSNECTVKTSMSCRSCHRECRSSECFIRHKEHRTSNKIVVPSRCDTWYKCRVCKKVSKCDDRNPSDHVCGELKCKTCEQYQVSEHFCFQRANTNESSEKKFIFYDFECPGSFD